MGINKKLMVSLFEELDGFECRKIVFVGNV